jgi:DNA topoisomerase-2
MMNQNIVDKAQKQKKKTDFIDNILCNQTSIIGRWDEIEEPRFIWDKSRFGVIKQIIAFVPGVLFIIDKLLINIVKQSKAYKITKTEIEIGQNTEITIKNYGIDVPIIDFNGTTSTSLIFGQFEDISSKREYDHDDLKTYLANTDLNAFRYANVYSTSFQLQVHSKSLETTITQKWENNMKTEHEMKTKNGEKQNESFTQIKFKLKNVDQFNVRFENLIKKRLIDLASFNDFGVIECNKEILPSLNFIKYANLFLWKEPTSIHGTVNLDLEKPNEFWQVGIAHSSVGFQQISFVNGYETNKGGTHVDHVKNLIVQMLVASLKTDKTILQNKIDDNKIMTIISKSLWLFIDFKLVNPEFDAISKTQLISRENEFINKFQLNSDFVKNYTKLGHYKKLIESIIKPVELLKVNKMKTIKQLSEINGYTETLKANYKLIIVQNADINSLLLRSLDTNEKAANAIFNLDDQFPNIADAKKYEIFQNGQVNNLIDIIGLNKNEKYSDSVEPLRYAKMILMFNHDFLGLQLKLLFLQYFTIYWPNLFKHQFIFDFRVPIYKVINATREENLFYNKFQYKNWIKNNKNKLIHCEKYNLVKLTSNHSKEMNKYFQNLDDHLISFDNVTAVDQLALYLALKKRYLIDRLDFLTKQHEIDRNFKTTIQNRISLHLFIMYDYLQLEFEKRLERLPSVIDGLHLVERQIVHTSFKLNNKCDLDFFLSVLYKNYINFDKKRYCETFEKLSENYHDSNTVPFFYDDEKFGIKVDYNKNIECKKKVIHNKLIGYIFKRKDDEHLNYESTTPDNYSTTPNNYFPILPTILINGADYYFESMHIKIPKFDLIEVINNLIALILKKKPNTMLPKYTGFKGGVFMSNGKFISHGNIEVVNYNKIHIDSLPVNVTIKEYKENVLISLLKGSPPKIMDFEEYHSTEAVNFVIILTREQFENPLEIGLYEII